jgi:hypothetical protein
MCVFKYFWYCEFSELIVCLPLVCVSDDLKNFFSKHGNVVEHEIIRDHTTKRSRGFGFVVFDNDKVVDNLLADGNMIDMDGTQVSSVHFFRVFNIGTTNTDDKLLIICFDVKVKECCCEIIDNWGFMLRSKSNNKMPPLVIVIVIFLLM